MPFRAASFNLTGKAGALILKKRIDSYLSPVQLAKELTATLRQTFGQFLRQGRPPFLTYIGSQGLPTGRSLLTGFGGSLPSGRNAHHGLPHGQPVEDLTAIVKVVNSPRDEGNVVVPTGFEPVF